MSQRPGIQLTVHTPVDGGEHPNRYIPRVSAHVRAYWPAHTPLHTVLRTMEDAYLRAVAEATAKWQREHPR